MSFESNVQTNKSKILEASPHPSSMVSLKSNGTQGPISTCMPTNKHTPQEESTSLEVVKLWSWVVFDGMGHICSFKIPSSPKGNLRQKNKTSYRFHWDFTADSGVIFKIFILGWLLPQLSSLKLMRFFGCPSIDASCRNLGKKHLRTHYWLNWSNYLLLNVSCDSKLSGCWLNQPLWKILVKLEIFPK